MLCFDNQLTLRSWLLDEHAGPAPFTACCNGQCIDESVTPCCATGDGSDDPFIVCPAGDICTMTEFIEHQNQGTCCAGLPLLSRSVLRILSHGSGCPRCSMSPQNALNQPAARCDDVLWQALERAAFVTASMRSTVLEGTLIVLAGGYGASLA